MESLLSRFRLNQQNPNENKSLPEKLLRRYQSSADTEHEQATLRLFLVLVGVTYIWLVTHSSFVGTPQERMAVNNVRTEWWWPSIFYIFALGHVASLLIYPGKIHLRCLIMVLLDNLVVSILVIQGGLFNPFIALYFWIAVGYGFRFGPNWLAYSTCTSVVCILSIFHFNPNWNVGSIFPAWLIVCLFTASSYAYFLLRRLRLTQQELLKNTNELEKLATRDSLTGLANRALLMDRLTQAITLAARTGNDVAILFIDVDGLKKVNDNIGHAVGDALLIEVAKRLQARLRAADTCARIAGDEFVIILEGVNDRASVLRVADIMLEEVRSLTIIAGQAIEISASLGIAWLSQLVEESRTPESLLDIADGAMYQAKRGGKNRYCVAASR
jgi:diguanylate cyclase (GGDEF)-like protein